MFETSAVKKQEHVECMTCLHFDAVAGPRLICMKCLNHDQYESMDQKAVDAVAPPAHEPFSLAGPLDTQIGGNHYTQMQIQPMEYAMANGLDACQHTIIKYVSRFRNKGGLEDLKKAKHTIDMLIAFEYGPQT